MMTIELWLGLILATSLLLNIILIWFARRQSTQLYYVATNMSDLIELIENYRTHLKKVYSMEMFYGDETLNYLLEHTRSLTQLLETEYGNITAISEPITASYEEETEIEEESEENPQEQDVLYAGSRRRDS